MGSPGAGLGIAPALALRIGYVIFVCGIAGRLGPDPLDDTRVAETFAGMRRRGPDATGAARLRAGGLHLDLLHTRLKIIDLDDRANQPMTIGLKTMVYNGELYNYREIRRRLEADGFPFRTTSDTEVLLAAIDRYGWGILEECEGMWAFALFDEETGDLSLCRDRFGEKPLYWSRTDDAFYFGSEPKFIFAMLGRTLSPNLDHVRRFLVNGYRSLYKSPATFFLGLEEVPAASRLVVRDGRPAPAVRYWSPPAVAEEEMDLAEAARRTREAVLRAVEIRLRSDVPLAFCMSGGVDSNALIAAAKRVFGYDVHGFTIADEDARYDERALARASASALGIRHTEVPLQREGFLENMRDLVAHRDAPVYTVSYYAHWLLCREIASRGYRVAVSGTGADEIFTGYYDHHLYYLAGFAEGDPDLFAARSAWERHVKPIVRNPHLRDPDLFRRDPTFRAHLYDESDAAARTLATLWREPFVEARFAPHLLRNRMLNELFHEVVPQILHEDDANSMFFSIENRSPFLDRMLFETSLRIPARLLVRDGYAKAVLREAMRGIAPDVVLDARRKVGFNASVLSFMEARDPKVSSRILADGPIFDLVRREAIEALLRRPSLTNAESKYLFAFLGCRVFLDLYG